MVLPTTLVLEALSQVHDNSGHLGIDKILAKIGDRFWWPGLTIDAKDWVTCSETCSRRMPAVKSRDPLTNSTVGGPMEMIAMDFLEPLPQANKGNTHLLVVADYYNKWVEAYALPDQKTTTVVQVLVDEVFSRFGVPAILHIDQGQNFESKIVQKACKLLGIKNVCTTPYHPHCDGLVE